ncbi:glycoside hydrolase family 43 protein [Demequina sp.]|uniref:glycoside hydrolase family 43 protein n=1 Tax=Demequina sp. TaxID=2050685 RepID=UPI003D0DD17A
MTSASLQPIIPGFYPDPTICKVGGDYYLANSSFEYFPGAPLWHSTDLITWTQIGNILTTREQFVEGVSRPSGGIYGSTLRHHDGLFYFITTNVSDYDSGQVVVTATDPAGPWSAPIHIREAIGIDPDLAWDEDGQAILTYKNLEFDKGTAGVMQAPVDLTTGALLSPLQSVWQGTGDAHPEGPHLYKIGDWWYMFLSEGGTERGHEITIARAERPSGPFEACPANPVYTRRSTDYPVQSVGHSDLVETPDGGWAIVHLANRPRGSTPGFHVLGRETFLAGVEWIDGWPRVLPEAFDIPPVDTAFEDDFSGPLDPRWVVPAGDIASVSVSGEGTSVPAGQFLCFRARDLRWRATAVLSSGGFEVRMDPSHGIGVRLADGVVTAFVRIQSAVAELGVASVGAGAVAVTLAAEDAIKPHVNLGDAGPDDIVVYVELDGEATEIGRFDGRYLSTEVASGFTGRVIALGAEDATTRVARVEYRSA